ncbi:BA75_04951T0 [Komagataella pastoris]|uniref:BA75_04951T0 n=1 Tax=Komagataella pastoris TaxID=4922 RepID=A0A1B2JJ05_PICPA|nr:BA75_04951T0 [Komagataella pastoris]
MRNRLNDLVVFFLLLTVAAQAHLVTFHSTEQLKFDSCKSSVEEVATFCSNSTLDKKFVCMCQTKPYLQTVLYCAENYASLSQSAIEKEALERCPKLDSESIQKTMQSLSSATFIDIDSDTSFSKKKVVTSPIKGQKYAKWQKMYYIGSSHRYDNYKTSHYLAAASVSYWLLILLLAGVCNWARVIAPKLAQSPALNNKLVRQYRKYISLPTLFGYHAKPVTKFRIFSGMAPTTLETIILSIFFVYCVLANGILGFSYQKNDPIFANQGTGYGRYHGDRSGILLSYHLPLLFIFAGRNNLFQYVTKWPQSRFLTFHKTLARIIFCEILVHAISFTVQTFSLGPQQVTKRLAANYYRWGIVGAVAAACVLISAVHRIRQANYDLFVLLHIILVAVFLAAAWIHAASQVYEQFYIACAAIWCFDRFIRLVRMFSFGIRTSKAELISNETIKLTIPRNASFRSFPNAYGYVYFVTPLTFYRSHPFTVVPSEDGKHIHFFVKVKGGLTSYISKKILQNDDLTSNFKICVEGPYGLSVPVHKYDTSLLIASGNGIPGPFAEAKEVAELNLKVHTKLYWIIRDWHSLNWFYPQIKSLEKSNVEIIIYVTNTTSSVDKVDFYSSSSSSAVSSDENKQITESKETTTQLDRLSFVEFRTGRPNLEEVLNKDISESNGTVSVLTCGHPHMCDHVRDAIARNTPNYKKRVDYFESVQVW